MPRARQPHSDAALFGAALRRARLARGWTITKLAQRSGLNAQYLGVIEAGRNVPTLYVILEVCEVLGVDAGELIREVAIARTQPKREASRDSEQYPQLGDDVLPPAKE